MKAILIGADETDLLSQVQLIPETEQGTAFLVQCSRGSYNDGGIYMHVLEKKLQVVLFQKPKGECQCR